MAGQRQIPNHAMPCHAMHIVFPEISRISACTRALGAYLHNKCNLSRTDEVFSFHFVRWGAGELPQGWGQRGTALVGRKSRTRSELSESEANEPKAKRFQLAKW